MYIAKRADVRNLLKGPNDEEGRIGYVAITRAKDLLFLAVPSSIKSDQRKSLEIAGFQAC